MPISGIRCPQWARPAPNLYFAEEVPGNQFKVAGGRAGQKISWYVTAIPQDAYAKANPLVVEEAKKPKEQAIT
jgi:hypothetical protein